MEEIVRRRIQAGIADFDEIMCFITGDLDVTDETKEQLWQELQDVQNSQ